MLTKVTAKSQWPSVADLVLNITDRPETDLFEVRNIDGLGPVKANVNTTPLGTIPGESFDGTNVGKRNIVFTLGLDPDWDTSTPSSLRRLLDKYFMPQLSVNLTFESTEFAPVQILGYVESNDPNMFSKDPEQQISIICPDPNFVGVDPVILDGNTGDPAINIDYDGNIETGIDIKVNKYASTANPSWVNIIAGDPAIAEFKVTATLDDLTGLEVSSVPGKKFADTIVVPGEVHHSQLSNLSAASKWPTIKPGITPFQVISDAGSQYWYMVYYNLFGSL